jgi:hypothetical protein
MCRAAIKNCSNWVRWRCPQPNFQKYPISLRGYRQRTPAKATEAQFDFALQDKPR